MGMKEVKKRQGTDPANLRHAMLACLLGDGGGKYFSTNNAAKVFEGVSQSALQSALTDVHNTLSKAGHDGYGQNKRGRTTLRRVGDEEDRLRRQIRKAVSGCDVKNPGNFYVYFTPDEEKFLVDIVE